MSSGDANVLDTSVEGEHDPHYEPIISLPEVTTSTNEEDESELIKLRAKLFRYDTNENPPEWKERGTGDVKLLRHLTKNTVRVVMRRDKTLKICANHFVTPYMELKPNCGSDRAWVWSVIADYTNETAQSELLAIKFANAENAKKWKEMFEEAKNIVATECELYTKDYEDSLNDSDTDEGEENNLDKTLQNLKLNDCKKEEDNCKQEVKESPKVDKVVEEDEAAEK